MKSQLTILKVLLDAGVPDSVGGVFTNKGHVTILHRNVLDEGANDELVCVTALTNSAILVAIDKDMKGLTKRFGCNHNDGRFENLSLILIRCNEVQASKRIDHSMSFIEHEWIVSKQKKARRLWVEIGTHHLKSNR